MTIRRIVTVTPIYLILIVIGIFFLAPLVWPVTASLNPTATLSVSMPRSFDLSNYVSIITSGLVIQPFANSLIMAVSTMILVILLAGLAAYPLSRYQFRLKAPLMYFILFASALPILALVTPLYSLYVTFNLVDTLQGCILFFTASALPFC